MGLLEGQCKPASIATGPVVVCDRPLLRQIARPASAWTRILGRNANDASGSVLSTTDAQLALFSLRQVVRAQSAMRRDPLEVLPKRAVRMLWSSRHIAYDGKWCATSRYMQSLCWPNLSTLSPRGGSQTLDMYVCRTPFLPRSALPGWPESPSCEIGEESCAANLMSTAIADMGAMGACLHTSSIASVKEPDIARPRTTPCVHNGRPGGLVAWWLAEDVVASSLSSAEAHDGNTRSADLLRRRVWRRFMLSPGTRRVACPKALFSICAAPAPRLQLLRASPASLER